MVLLSSFVKIVLEGGEEAWCSSTPTDPPDI